jgi:hypothetical protein
LRNFKISNFYLVNAITDAQTDTDKSKYLHQQNEAHKIESNALHKLLINCHIKINSRELFLFFDSYKYYAKDDLSHSRQRQFRKPNTVGNIYFNFF